ncbi:MAG: BMP family ABC transporter substrate-binding protein [Propionibacteriaceae bacterium]|nr:BMP family ABC transporter substrate-binding protein [Propionibacteriaceae bacterium]
MKKSPLAAVALACASALLIAGCAEDPSSSPSNTTTTTDAPKFKACIVSDMGGFDDKSFNQTSYAGVQQAVKEFGIEEAKVQSVAESDYGSNVQSMVDVGCNIVVGVGFALSDAIQEAAKANPNVYFAVVDDAAGDGTLANVKGLTFQTNENGFLAGYLAASMSKTGKVATYGGINYPSVTIFMDGYVLGVEYYNAQKGTNVEVIGWDAAAGTYAEVNSFTEANLGKTLAQTQVDQGADVLFPVAGNAGTGALQVAQESNGKVLGIWVDTDGYVSSPQYGSVLLTSVEKAVDKGVYEAIKAAYENKWDNKPYVGTLANDGVVLSPFHDFDSVIPADTKAELDTIKAGIIGGTIKATR